MSKRVPRTLASCFTVAIVCGLPVIAVVMSTADRTGSDRAGGSRFPAVRLDDVPVGDRSDASRQTGDQLKGVVVVRGDDRPPTGTVICKYDDGAEFITRFTQGEFFCHRPSRGEGCEFLVYVDGASQVDAVRYDDASTSGVQVLMEKACIVTGKYLAKDHTPKMKDRKSVV